MSLVENPDFKNEFGAPLKDADGKSIKDTGGIFYEHLIDIHAKEIAKGFGPASFLCPAKGTFKMAGIKGTSLWIDSKVADDPRRREKNFLEFY